MHNHSCVAPEDYDAVRRSITLSPGNNTESVSISISDDEAVEFNERFIVIIEVTGEFSDLVKLTLRMAEIIILNDDGKERGSLGCGWKWVGGNGKPPPLIKSP